MSYRMPRELRRLQWDIAVDWLRPEDPVRRAKFGRYVGSLGGTLTAVSSGRPAWVACYREKGVVGFHNRAYRRALARHVPINHTTWNWGPVSPP